MKQNTTKNMSTPTPTRASRFRANSVKASFHPLWTGPTSPPSGAARVMSSGGSSGAICVIGTSGGKRRQSARQDARGRGGKSDAGSYAARDHKRGAGERAGGRGLAGGLAQRIAALRRTCPRGGSGKRPPVEPF